MTFLVGGVGSDEHAPSLLSPLDTVEAGDLPSDAGSVVRTINGSMSPSDFSRGTGLDFATTCLCPDAFRGLWTRYSVYSLLP